MQNKFYFQFFYWILENHQVNDYNRPSTRGIKISLVEETDGSK